MDLSSTEGGGWDIFERNSEVYLQGTELSKKL
jgi:hypothetical protein